MNEKNLRDSVKMTNISHITTILREKCCLE